MSLDGLETTLTVLTTKKIKTTDEKTKTLKQHMIKKKSFIENSQVKQLTENRRTRAHTVFIRERINNDISLF